MSLAHVLTTHSLEGIDHLATPEEGLETSMNTPALDVFTDYMHYRPLVVEDTMPASRCEDLMRKSHIKLMLVVDTNEHLLGMVDLADLMGPKLQKLVGPDRPISQISVHELMTPSSELKVIDYQDLQNATVGDLVETLKLEHCPYILVADPPRNEVRGVISASELGHRLNVPLDITYAPTFADICHATLEHIP